MEEFTKKEKWEIYNAICALHVFVRDNVPDSKDKRQRMLLLGKIMRKWNSIMKESVDNFPESKTI